MSRLLAHRCVGMLERPLPPPTQDPCKSIKGHRGPRVHRGHLALRETLGEWGLAARVASWEKVGSGGAFQRTLNSSGKLGCALRGGLGSEAQSLMAKGWGSPGTRFRFS